MARQPGPEAQGSRQVLFAVTAVVTRKWLLLPADHQNRKRTWYRCALASAAAAWWWRRRRATLLRHREKVARLADDSGQRSGSIVFDMKDASQIPAVAEPWFLAFNAQVSLRPVMNPQDLAKAGPSIGKAAKKYGPTVSP